jgi:RNA polymerase sigma-70 factor (ECF subfamily)
MTDEELVSHVQKGIPRMFAELVRRHQDPLYGLALRFTGSAHDAEDIAQEAFLKAYRGLGDFKGDARFSTWLYRIAYNLCVDWLRRNRRPDRRASSIDEAGETADGRADLEGDYVAAEERERVRRAVDALDEKYRSVVVMLYYQKLSYGEIAAVLDVPLKTVETRLYRARRIMREALERDAVEAEP